MRKVSKAPANRNMWQKKLSREINPTATQFHLYYFTIASMQLSFYNKTTIPNNGNHRNCHFDPSEFT